MRRSIVCLLLSGFLAACSTSPAFELGSVVVKPSKNAYAAGEPVTAQLSNGSSSEIGFGACALRAERLTGSQWVLVGSADAPCTLQLILLGAHDERTLQLYDSLTLPGEYRLRFEFAPHSELSVGERIYSPSFSVVAPQ